MQELINEIFGSMAIKYPEQHLTTIESKKVFKQLLIKKIKNELKTQRNESAVLAMKLYKRINNASCLIAFNQSPFDLAIIEQGGEYEDIISYSQDNKAMQSAIDGVLTEKYGK